MCPIFSFLQMQTVALEGVRGGVDMRAKCGNGGAEWGWQGGGIEDRNNADYPAIN